MSQQFDRTVLPAENQELPRKLGLTDTASLLVGTVIGGGIFLVPGLIASVIPSPPAIILVWIFGGILSFFGALAYAELGSMFPATGGQYVFLRESFGPLSAFLFGWSIFAVVMPAQIGSLAVGFSIYAGHFRHLTPFAAKICSIVLIALLTAANYAGVRGGARVQNTCTFVKLAGLGIIIVSACFWQGGSHLVGGEAIAVPWSRMGAVLVPCLLSYDGWNTVSFVAGEIRNPQKTFPLALAVGLGVVTLVYLAFNIAALHVLPVDTIASSERVGSTLAEMTLGKFGAGLVTFTILISVAGSLNSALMTPPRLYFAQARDGQFFRSFGRVHPVHRTPGAAILLQGFLGAIAAVVGTFRHLITFAIFASWLFYIVTIAGMIALRLRRPELTRPYRMWGYPVTAIVFLLVAVSFIVSIGAAEPLAALLALVIIGAGVPIYFAWRSWPFGRSGKA